MGSLFLLKRSGRWPVLMAILPFALLMAWRTWLNVTYQPYTSLEQLPAGQVALVFGAGIRNNRPSAVLADRVEAAAALYHAGKVQKLLMTGDNRYLDYNEPAVMQAYAIELKVPAEDIILDYAGRRTYDSCYRAREIFGLGRSFFVGGSRVYFPQAIPPAIKNIICPILLRFALVHLPAIIARRR